ncbi:MAG: hypothetical protein HYW24_05520 [Candidatus Aenigmarchaeota archaeon]|nr:hypothetical protein [Candidatus Aenigmarchaeota archaeon]
MEQTISQSDLIESVTQRLISNLGNDDSGRIYIGGPRNRERGDALFYQLEWGKIYGYFPKNKNFTGFYGNTRAEVKLSDIPFNRFEYAWLLNLKKSSAEQLPESDE